ncbi:MAG: acyl-CoA dehydrogenase [Anaerolineaceae bacterium]|nr:acyl-CoA dehydrogenase [Anaerolineaceae bacterium]
MNQKVKEQPKRKEVDTAVSPSFVKPLFLGEIHEDLVLPYPRPEYLERQRINELIEAAWRFTDEHYDPRQAEAYGWVGDDIIAGLGERGLLGLYISPKYGGQGLSQTGYGLVFEEIGCIDPTLSVVLGVHQSIGMKGIHMFGSEAQKDRFLPDLAAGRKLAAFALTEPNAGSDAYHIQSRAIPQRDGSYRLFGEKRYIGNGSKDVLTVFARTDEGAHVALIVEKGMEGLEVGRSYPTMGLKANDLRHLKFNDVRVPPENVLGEEGDGFKIAVEVLNNGRLSLGAGSIGSVKKLLRLAVNHTLEREQFGRPLAEFGLVEDKIGWTASYLYGLQSMAYLNTGLVDAGMPDYSLESAIVKVAGTEFLWYAANRMFQLAGGEAYITDQPYEKILRDIRVFPIFEGANDVLRVFIALSGLKPLANELSDLQEVDFSQPIRSLGVLADYVENRIRREIQPDRLNEVHADLKPLADPVTDQVKRLRHVSEKLLRQHGEDVQEEQRQLKRLAHAVIDIYAQVATISRVSDVLERDLIATPAEERYIAETFCARAARRVQRCLDQIEDNDDERMHRIARAAYVRRGYEHSI